MLERFTERALKVMVLANLQAQKFSHECIDSEHILLGILKEGSGVACAIFNNLNVSLREIELKVQNKIKIGPDPDMVTMGKLPKTPAAKMVIKNAIAEARRLNHNYVGTEHLLLGLLEEKSGFGGQILRDDFNLKIEDVRKEVLQVLGEKEKVLGSPVPQDEITAMPALRDRQRRQQEKPVKCRIFEISSGCSEVIGDEKILTAFLSDKDFVSALALGDEKIVIFYKDKDS